MFLEALEIIKPKRLSENKAIISDSFICLDLGSTLIYKECQTKFGLCEIGIKDLYSNNYDEAVAIDKFNLTIPELEYTKVSINVNDSVYLSATSAAGEDIFFNGYITISNNSIQFTSYGLVYLNKYASSKILTLKEKINHHIDYNVFYYLFQLFKNLSGKKLDTLLVALKDNILYLTNEDNDYLIISKLQNKFKVDSAETINKFYNSQILKNEKKINKKDFSENPDSFIKHLIRPLSDECTFEENEAVNKLYSQSYMLFINKEK